MAYRCVAASAAGFVQQLAVGCVARGYWFYVTGEIPAWKDAARTDAKLLTQYGLDVSKWTRARQRKAGRAGVQYLRYGRFFVIVATHGEHDFFAAEAGQIRDIRRHPLRFRDYAIGCRRGRDGRWHVAVRIASDRFSEIKQRFEAVAAQRTVEELWVGLRSLPFEPYAPVRDQFRILLRAVNRRRKAAGLELVPHDALRQRRAIVRPFGETSGPAEDDAASRTGEIGTNICRRP